MKKILFILLSIGLIFTACKKESVVTPVAELNVERTAALDREQMYLNYRGDYRWYESCILLQDFLDEECDGTIAGISNVFQVITSKDSSNFDTRVILMAHAQTADTVETVFGFWVGDFPLNVEEINITFKEAFEKINEVNLPKPHSKYCVLRKEVGPVPANPQYVFGNIQSQLYVDAVTGEVSETNPAFNGFEYSFT